MINRGYWYWMHSAARFLFRKHRIEIEKAYIDMIIYGKGYIKVKPPNLDGWTPNRRARV